MVYIYNSSLAFTILRKLVDNNMRYSIFPVSSEFSEEEIASIENLTLTEADDLSEITKLTSLKALTIKGSNVSEEDIPSNDYSAISLMHSLENLSIINVRNIKKIDIENLSNLKVLKLVNNENLEELCGVSKLKKLEQVVICGNDISRIENPKEYIDNTADTRLNILDVNIFARTLIEYPDMRKYVEDKINSKWSNIKFGEMLKFDNECYILDFYEFMKMYDTAVNILSELILKSDTDIDKAHKIYRYIVNNIKYAQDALEYRELIYNNNREYVNQNEYLRQRILLINSSYGAIINKMAVCDGYMNMMKLLLNMCNIKSKKVLCSITTNSPWKTDHVIIKFKNNETGEWFYADPEKQQREEDMDFFGLSLEEISKTHIFPFMSEEGNFVKTIGK